MDKRGPPYTDQEDINKMADKLAGNAKKSLPEDFKAHHDSLDFLEQHISLCLHGQNVTSKITRNIAYNFHKPKLEEHIKEREEWIQNMWEDITWKSFKIAFNKTRTARQSTFTKLIFSLRRTNKRHRRNQGRINKYCFCKHIGVDWKHILMCPGAGATINRKLPDKEINKLQQLAGTLLYYARAVDPT
jgi:hypothetical protein